jgi:hypothetical protein
MRTVDRIQKLIALGVAIVSPPDACRSGDTAYDMTGRVAIVNPMSRAALIDKVQERNVCLSFLFCQGGRAVE